MNSRIRSGWTQFLSRHDWDVFMTLTFDAARCRRATGLSDERIDKSFRKLIALLNGQLYGKRHLRTSRHKGVVWARVQETHGDGVWHFHACIASPTAKVPTRLLLRATDWWESRYGFARIGLIRSQEGALQYLLKHSADSRVCEVEFSHNFALS